MERVLAEELAKEEAVKTIKSTINMQRKEAAMRQAEEEAKIQERILAEEMANENI